MFARGLAGYLPANAAQAIVGLGSLALFTRLLKPQEYGAYALAFSAMSLAHTLVFTWLEAAMARFWVRARDDGEAAAHLATLYGLWLRLAIALAAIGTLALVLVPAPSALKWTMAAGIFAILSRSLLKLAQERRRAEGAVAAAASLDLFHTLAGFALGVGFVLAGWGAAGVLAGLGAAAAIALIRVLPVELALTRRDRIQPARSRASLAYGAPIAASLVLGAVLSSADRFILEAFRGPAAVGAYHAAAALAGRGLDVLFVWLGAAGGPALVAALERGGRAALLRAARAQAELIAAIALPAAVGLALLARPLCALFLGSALRGAAPAVPWLVLAALIFGFTTYYLGTAFTLARRTGRMIAGLAIAAAVNLAANLALVPAFGAVGAAEAAAAGYAAGAAAALVLGRPLLPLPLPLATFAKAGLASALMAAALRLAQVAPGAGQVFVLTPIGLATYAAAALALDVGRLRSRLFRRPRARLAEEGA